MAQPHPNDRIVSAAFLSAYEELSRGKRTIVKPGDKVRMAGLDITTVASANQYLRSNLPGGGGRMPSCAGVPPKDESAYIDPDNGDSAGFVLAYGRFRTIDLGDLTWNGELDLMCPTNRIGTVDLYLTSHHGLEQSGSPALVHALRPRVAVMNNGTRKGGAPDAFRVLHESPGLEDLWQLHWSYNVGLDNAPATFVANVDDNATVAGVLTAPAPAGRRRRACRGALARTPDQGERAQQDGTFTVTNTRSGFSKTYRPARDDLAAALRSVRQPAALDGGCRAAGAHALLRAGRAEEARLGVGAVRAAGGCGARPHRVRDAGGAGGDGRAGTASSSGCCASRGSSSPRSFSTTSPRDRPVPGDEGLDRRAFVGQAPAARPHRVLLRRVPRGHGRRRRAGGDCRVRS